MERGCHTGVTERAAFFVDEAPALGAQVSLSEADVKHVHVLRLGPGDAVGLRDGRGTVATGTLVRLSRSQGLVEVRDVERVAAPPAVHLLVPIADRERMLWLAEKAAELAVTSWRPVLWRRSRSVAPRGDGSGFRARVHARMVGALLQSRGAWLPELFPDVTPERAAAAAPAGSRLVMQRNGEVMSVIPLVDPAVIAVGPEGGFEPDELELLEGVGFRRAALGGTVLRFETAAVSALAVARVLLAGRAGDHADG